MLINNNLESLLCHINIFNTICNKIKIENMNIDLNFLYMFSILLNRTKVAAPCSLLITFLQAISFLSVNITGLKKSKFLYFPRQ